MKLTKRLAVLFLITAGVSPSRAQYPSLRATDTRTIDPEMLMTDRKQWGADLDFGGAFNRGNADVDFVSSGFKLFKSSAAHAAYMSGSMLYNTFNHVRILNQGALTARYDYQIRAPWKIFAFNTNAYNQFTQLNYRSTTGVGPWYDFTLGPTEHGASLAMVYEYENYVGHIYNRDARISFRDISEFPISPAANICTDFFYIPRADLIADYRMYGQIALESLIWKKNLTLKLSWTDEYNNRPRPGVKPNDSIWLTSLGLRLGQ